MRDARLFITGITGFTGRHLAREASSQGFRCFGLTRNPKNQVEAAESLVTGDLADPRSLEHAVREIRPDYVVHLAAESFVGHKDYREIYTHNIVGTLNLLDALHTHAPEVRKVLLASSGNIYGNASSLPIEEGFLPMPENDYGVSKVAMELAVRLRMPTLPLVLSRPFNYTGRGQSKQFLIPKIVDAYQQGLRDLELGNLDVKRDFSDVRDVVSAYAKLLLSNARSQVFNVCSGQSTSLMEIIERMNRLAGYEMTITTNPDFVRAGEIKDLYGSEDKLRAVIGEYRRYTLNDTLQWMYASG